MILSTSPYPPTFKLSGRSEPCWFLGKRWFKETSPKCLPHIFYLKIRLKLKTQARRTCIKFSTFFSFCWLFAHPVAIACKCHCSTNVNIFAHALAHWALIIIGHKNSMGLQHYSTDFHPKFNTEAHLDITPSQHKQNFSLTKKASWLSVALK